MEITRNKLLSSTSFCRPLWTVNRINGGDGEKVVLDERRKNQRALNFGEEKGNSKRNEVINGDWCLGGQNVPESSLDDIVPDQLAMSKT